ncbi:MAG: hypothetical protein KY433_08980 [Actinobacteria bacterium]|nr:hypothetical protein [Actinomycetota bacterium]
MVSTDPGLRSAAATLAAEVVAVPAPSRAVLHELQLVAVDLLAAATDRELAVNGAAPARPTELIRR